MASSRFRLCFGVMVNIQHGKRFHRILRMASNKALAQFNRYNDEYLLDLLQRCKIQSERCLATTHVPLIGDLGFEPTHLSAYECFKIFLG